MTKMERTPTPGVYRRHVKDCARKGRCECAYVVVWRHRGRQRTETFRTFAEAREAQGGRQAGDRRARVKGSLFRLLRRVDRHVRRPYRPRLLRDNPAQYRRPIEAHAIPKWGTWKLAEVEPADVRELFGALRRAEASSSQIRKLRAALSAMFANAVDDGLLRSNPCQGVRIPVRSRRGAHRAPREGDDAEGVGCGPRTPRTLAVGVGLFPPPRSPPPIMPPAKPPELS